MKEAPDPVAGGLDPDDQRPLPGEPLPSETGGDSESLPSVSETMRLLEVAKAGDRESRDAVFERYRPRLLRVIRMRMGHDLERLASPEDVLQETMVTWLMRFDSFAPEHRGGLFAWLDLIARGKIKDLRNKARVRGHQRPVGAAGKTEDAGATGSVELPGKGPGPVTANLALELKQRFDDAVATLSERERDLVVLRIYLQLEWPDIVAQMGFPNEHAGQQALCRVRDKLRKQLQGA